MPPPPPAPGARHFQPAAHYLGREDASRGRQVSPPPSPPGLPAARGRRQTKAADRFFVGHRVAYLVRLAAPAMASGGQPRTAVLGGQLAASLAPYGSTSHRFTSAHPASSSGSIAPTTSPCSPLTSRSPKGTSTPRPRSAASDAGRTALPAPSETLSAIPQPSGLPTASTASAPLLTRRAVASMSSVSSRSVPATRKGWSSIASRMRRAAPASSSERPSPVEIRAKPVARLLSGKAKAGTPQLSPEIRTSSSSRQQTSQ